MDGSSERPAVNAVDGSGNTALHYAARAGDAVCCGLLLGRGAILTLVNGSGETPVDLAAAAAGH